MANRVSRFCVAAVALGLSVAALADLTLNNVRIEDGLGKLIEKGTIVVSGDRIEYVGDTSATSTKAPILDGSGWVVYPAFIDAYSLRGMTFPDPPAPALAPNNRTTAPAFMWPQNRKGIRPDLVAAKCLDIGGLRGLWREQGFGIAVLAPGQGQLRGIASAIFLGETPSALVPELGVDMSVRGGGFGGGGNDGFPGGLLGILSQLRQTLYDCKREAEGNGDENSKDLKPFSILWSGKPGLIFADNEREIGRALSFKREFQFPAILISAREAYLRVQDIKAAGTTVAVSVSPGFEPSLTPRPNGPPKEVLQERHDRWESGVKNAATLDAAGIPLVFSTEGDVISDFLENIRLAIKHGLSRESALKGLTSRAAELFGLSDFGSVAPGKKACLAIFDGDFANEKSKVIGMIVDGKFVDFRKGGTQ